MSITLKFDDVQEMRDFVQNIVEIRDYAQEDEKSEYEDGMGSNVEHEFVAGIKKCIRAEIPLHKLLVYLFCSEEDPINPCTMESRAISLNIKEILEDLLSNCQWLLCRNPPHFVMFNVTSLYLSAQFDKGREFQKNRP